MDADLLNMMVAQLPNVAGLVFLGYVLNRQVDKIFVSLEQRVSYLEKALGDCLNEVYTSQDATH